MPAWGGALALAAAEGGVYTVSLLGTRAGHYSLAVLFNGSAVEAGASSSFRDIPVATPLAMNVTFAAISALGCEVVADSVMAPGWSGGDVNGYVDSAQAGFYTAQEAVNKFAMRARDRSDVLL